MSGLSEANADVQRAIEINYHNEDFEQLFKKLFDIQKFTPCLI